MIRALLRSRDGAAIVEFAFLAPVFCLLLTGGLELGYRVYLTSIIQGALLEASREATVGNMTGAQIDDIIRKRVGMLTKPEYVKEIKKESFYNFSNVGKPEKITQDTDPIGSYNTGDCYEDANNNNVYDSNLTTGLGTADDIVRYSVRVEYPSLTPLAKMTKQTTLQTINATTVLRNQPFTSRAAPTERCS